MAVIMAVREPVVPAENQKRLLQTVFFMPNSDLSLLKGIIEKLPNRWTDYAEFLAWAILANKTDVAAFLIEDGAALDSPPAELSSDTYGVSPETAEALKSYRRTPYLILAASRSSEQMIELLLTRGSSLRQMGYVGSSKSRLNSVITNVLGAAVFHNRLSIINWLFSKFSPEELGIEQSTQEEKSVGKSLSKEYTGCTPLLLSMHRCDTPDIPMTLLAHGAAATAVDWQGNTALHIAATLHKTEMVRFLLGLGTIQQTRNVKGDTPFSIAKERGFRDVVEVLGSQGEDTSAREAEELFQLIRNEEQKEKKPKAKKAKKKPVDESKSKEIVEIPKEKPVVVSKPEVVSEEKPVVASKPMVVSEEKPEKVEPVSVPDPTLQCLHSFLGSRTDLTALSGSELRSLKDQLEAALATVQSVLSRK